MFRWFREREKGNRGRGPANGSHGPGRSIPPRLLILTATDPSVVSSAVRHKAVDCPRSTLDVGKQKDPERQVLVSVAQWHKGEGFEPASLQSRQLTLWLTNWGVTSSWKAEPLGPYVPLNLWRTWKKRSARVLVPIWLKWVSNSQRITLTCRTTPKDRAWDYDGSRAYIVTEATAAILEETQSPNLLGVDYEARVTRDGFLVYDDGRRESLTRRRNGNCVSRTFRDSDNVPNCSKTSSLPVISETTLEHPTRSRALTLCNLIPRARMDSHWLGNSALLNSCLTNRPTFAPPWPKPEAKLEELPSPQRLQAIVLCGSVQSCDGPTDQGGCADSGSRTPQGHEEAAVKAWLLSCTTGDLWPSLLTNLRIESVYESTMALSAALSLLSPRWAVLPTTRTLTQWYELSWHATSRWSWRDLQEHLLGCCENQTPTATVPQGHLWGRFIVGAHELADDGRLDGKTTARWRVPSCRAGTQKHVRCNNWSSASGGYAEGIDMRSRGSVSQLLSGPFMEMIAPALRWWLLFVKVFSDE